MVFQLTALLILALFYGCYLMKAACQKKKGIKTNQMGAGKTGRIKLVEITVFAATMLVLVAELISIAMNISALPLACRVTGATSGIIGVVFFISAVVQMRDSWRAGVPQKDKTEFVSGGVFQISRNPAFLGFDLVYIGLLMMFFSWWLLAVSLFAVVMLHIQITKVEEPFLNKTFGWEYSDYCRKVRRYLGRK